MVSTAQIATLILTEIANINAQVNSNITTNGNNEITGAKLNAVLQIIKDAINNIDTVLKDSLFNKTTDTTNDIIEGNNDTKWFFSEPHFLTRFATRTTDNLTEGSLNLYFTNTRADARINALRPTQASVTAPVGSTTVTVPNGGGNVSLIDAEARTAINALIAKLTAANILS